MSKFTVEYYEWYKDSYEVEAENEEDARKKLLDEIYDGKLNGPEQCYNSGIISVTEIIEPTLAEIIAEERIDEIEDDQEFCEAENEVLAKRIIDCISDGYDDEEYRDETMQNLVAELDQGNFENIKAALKELCSRVEI